MRASLIVALRRVHRMLGTAMALLVAVWFASGFAMMFVTFPRLSDAERVAGSEAIDASALTVPVALRDTLARGDFPLDVRVRIAVIEGRPVLIAKDDEGRTHLSTAREGDARPLFDATRIRAMAERRSRRRVSAIERCIEPDQWTVPGSLSDRLPLYRVSLDDPEHTELYFTEDTGELVQRTTRKERVLAWLGPIPHWIYPTMLRRDRGTWRTVVLTLTCICLVVAVSGLVSGVRVWAKLRHRRPEARIRDRWLRYHQAIGLVLAIPALTWLASGAFSLSPFGRFGGPTPSAALLHAVHGVLVLPSDDVLREAITRCAGGGRIHEAELFAFLGETRVECTREDATRTTYALDGRVLRGPDTPAIAARVGVAFRGPAIRSVSELEEDELVYFDHHDGDPVGPVVRIEIADSDETAVYVDARRGIVVAQHTRATRLDRWLYQGLHRWDPGWLRRHERVRYGLVGTAMLLGVVLSCLGIAMAIRRQTRRLCRPRANRSRYDPRTACRAPPHGSPPKG